MNLIRFINKLKDRKHFTLESYEELLKSISKYTVLPLNEFRNYHNDKEVVIGLRHDSDSDFRALERMAWIEDKHNIRSTYFILHSADYYKPEIFPALLKMQSLGFEIGVHQDCMSNNNPHILLRYHLGALNAMGLKITGTSAHGDKEHKNIHFWEHFNKEDFGILYESYELDYNQYYSDCTFIDGHRWHPNMIDYSKFVSGSRIQILIHPEHWK